MFNFSHINIKLPITVLIGVFMTAAFKLPELPYDIKGLEPHISAETLSFHHGKHHQAYVDNLNKLVAGTPMEANSLEDVIKMSANDPAKSGIFNNAAQVWNHTFYWHCMKPNGGGSPQGELSDQIEKDFGSLENLIAEMEKAGATQFGSGWAWLVWDKKLAKLEVMKTANADLPMVHGKEALLTVDVWEHAYYLDYQNRRPVYLTTFFKSLVNWEFVETNFSAVK